MKRRADYILKMLEDPKPKNNDSHETESDNIISSPSIIENTPSPPQRSRNLLHIPCTLPEYEENHTTPARSQHVAPLLPPQNTMPLHNISPDSVHPSSSTNKNVLSLSNNDEITQTGSQQRSRASSTSSNSSSSSSSSSSSTGSDTSSSSSSSSKSANESVSRMRNGKRKPVYITSPIHPDESDVDLSDNDPTYHVPTERQNRASSGSPNSSSFVSPNQNQNRSSPPADVIPASNITQQSTDVLITKTGRKRKSQPNLWEKNQKKHSRNSGKAYISASKKTVPARSLKPASNCRLKCADNINDDQRSDIFKSYWELQDINLQRAFVRACMVEIIPKYKYSNSARPRKPNSAFYFTVNTVKIRVCKKMFMNTLDITDRHIRTVKQKTNASGFVEKDRRGTHENKKTLDPDLVKRIREHISAIPRIEGHYTRSDTSDDMEYIADGKTIVDLCQDFNNEQEALNKSKCEYWQYLNIFNNDFKIGFFQPKKDRCETCVAFQFSSGSQKLSLKAAYDKHQAEKVLSRQEKRTDRINIDDNHICAVYDLQAVMLCPSPKYFYYASKINCLNFTITELNKKAEGHKSESYKNVMCYYWDETQGQRGVNEIGSCVFDYIANISTKNPGKQMKLTFYSDNCAGQNKNKAMACLYSYAVFIFPNIESITHKFLIKGHTQNEADNVHSLIGSSIRNHEKSGPIYTPYQFPPIMQNARKTGTPFKVKELTHNFFKNLKGLQEIWGYNFNENINKNKLIWNDLRVLMFRKADTFKFYYKTSYEQTDYDCIDMRNKRKKMPSGEEVKIENMPLYEEKLQLKEKKKKDLKDLLKKGLIPSYYAQYFNDL